MECIVCKNTNSFSHFLAAKKEHPHYWRCEDCGFVFAYPQLRMDYRTGRFIPPSDAELETRFANYALRYSVIKPFLCKQTPELLDIGAYSGIFLKYVRSEGVRGIGIEPNLSAANYAKTILNVDVRPISFDDYNDDKQFDTVTMFNVLEHLPDPVNTISKVRKHLDKDGILVLELPNIFHMASLLSFGHWHHFQSDHNWFFARKTITVFLNTHGFVVQNFTFMPKIVTLATCFDNAMNVLRIYNYVSRKAYLRLREKGLYKYLISRQTRINTPNYFLVVGSLT